MNSLGNTWIPRFGEKVSLLATGGYEARIDLEAKMTPRCSDEFRSTLGFHGDIRTPAVILRTEVPDSRYGCHRRANRG